MIREVLAAWEAGDLELLTARLGDLDHCLGGWGALLRRIATTKPRAPRAAQKYLFVLMQEHGDHLRQEAGGDLALIKALRAVYPPYRGRGLRLYRGETAGNRRRRTYGISWTTDRAVAESFATSFAQYGPGGSVLLAADVPPEAIIRRLRGGRHAYERQVWVDRRALGRVRVLRRYPQREFVGAQ